MKKPWSLIMLDNILAGMHLDYGLEATAEEATVLKDALERIDGTVINEKELTVNKVGKNGVSDMSIDLRRDKYSKGKKEKWYFNVHGNPVNHRYGTNILGFPEADWQIEQIMGRCLTWIAEESGVELPDSLYRKVREGEIFLHSLEFAAYSNKLAVDLQAFIGGWWTMFGIARLQDPESPHRTLSLDELLGVNSRVDEVEYKNTFTVVMNESYSIESAKLGNAARYRKEATAGLRFYDKEVELERRGHVVPSEKLSIIENRLRVDLQLYHKWFTLKRVRTVAQLRDYVRRAHGGNWKQFILHEIHKVIDKACLSYMFNFPVKVFTRAQDIPESWVRGEPINDETSEWASTHGIRLDVSYAAHLAMANGRRMRQELLDQYLAKHRQKLPEGSAWESVQAQLAKNLVASLEFDLSEIAR